MTPGELKKAATRYMELRTKRLGLQKQADELKTEEDMLRQLIKVEMMGRLDKHGTLHTPEGTKLKVELKMKASAELTDWEALQKHIMATGEFDLIHKRVTETAVRARWEVGQEVPGVTQKQDFEVSITKMKE